jgi:hypothetical protein
VCCQGCCALLRCSVRHTHICLCVGRYAWDDVISGSIFGVGLTRPVVQVDLGLLKVECIGGQMHTTTLFYETLLDSRKPGEDNAPFTGSGVLGAAALAGDREVKGDPSQALAFRDWACCYGCSLWWSGYQAAGTCRCSWICPCCPPRPPLRTSRSPLWGPLRTQRGVRTAPRVLPPLPPPPTRCHPGSTFALWCTLPTPR